MKLVVDTIPDNFNIIDYFPVGIYCFAEREHIYSDLSKINFLKLELSNKELCEIDALTAKEALRLTEIIAKKHYPDEFSKHSFRFWKTIYYPLIGIIVQSVYSKQLLFEKLVYKFGNTFLEVDILKDEFEFEFKDENSSIKTLLGYRFSGWIFSRFIENYKEKLPWVINKIPSKPQNFEIIKPTNKSRNWRNFFMDKMRIKNVYGFSLIDILFFNLITFGRKGKTSNDKEINFSELPYLEWKIDILDIINNFIPNIYKEISFENNLKSYQIFDFSNELYYNFEYKLKAAKAKEKGNIIITSQHGGHNYGSAITFEYNKYIEYDSDYHLSWGTTKYKENVNAKFIPLPSPLLSKNLNKYIGLNKKIIWVGTAMSLTPVRPENFFWDFTHIYREKKLIGLQKIIKSSIGNDFFYRPYPEDFDRFLEDETYFKRLIPDIQILDGDLHQELKKCGLLILDHPGTTWNLAMAMNTPLVLYWDIKWFPFNEEASEFLNEFKSLGIFFENSLEMIKHVELLKYDYVNYYNWWSGNKIQNLRMKWMKKYAYADKKWRNKWFKNYLTL